MATRLLFASPSVRLVVHTLLFLFLSPMSVAV